MSPPPEIKFTSFGIPYLLEFENVSFAPCRAERPPSPSSSDSSFCYIECPPTPPRPPLLSLFRRKHRPSGSADPILTPLENTKLLPPAPSETNGIYIQFPLGHAHLQLSRKKRLVHLQKAISIAVLDAGMSRSPGNTVRPENRSIDNTLPQGRGQKTPDALFCGTYGQMMAALEAAGLSVTPCLDNGLSECALFVARNDGTNGVQLRNITLWG